MLLQFEVRAATMCTGNVPCFHGTCTSFATDKTTNAVCMCEDMYSGSQCGYRNGLLYFELPLSSILILAFVMLGLRLSEAAWRLLRFPESKQDFFEFPRTFQPATRVNAHLQRFVGTWEGPTHKQIAMSKHLSVTRILVILVILFELLPFMQIGAMSFLSIVPWSITSKRTAEFLRLLLLYPLWAHQEAAEYPHLVFYCAVAAIPALCILAVGFGLKRFPLFKPQPFISPTEDLCTLVLRALCSWLTLPLMIALLMPLECLFVGFLREGIPFKIPVYDPVCFTWLRLGHITLGFTTMSAYSFLVAGVGIQLNCESSQPQPTLWTDARYTRIVHALQPPLALSIIAFGNSNPLGLCICCTMTGLCLAVLNLWFRPCIFSVVNWLRLYGAVLATWTGLLGIVTSVIDDPWNSSTFEMWSLGAIALTAVTFSSLVVQYSEEFWFQLSLLKSRQWTSSRAMTVALPKGNGEGVGAKDDQNTDISHEKAPSRIPHIDLAPLRPRLPPLHVLKKRSRRSVAPRGNKILATQQ